MDTKTKLYKKDFKYSYAIGVFPTLELLKSRSSKVIKVLLSSKSSKNEGVANIRRLCHRRNIRTELADRLIEKLAGKRNCYAIGVFKKYSSEIGKSANHLVLVGIRDMGNLGTICRTMLGFNFRNLVIVKPAVDIFAPRVVRASMGAIFHLNFQYFDKFEDYDRAFTNTKYSFMTNGRVTLDNTVFKKPYALIFGNEASGLDVNYLKTSTSVTIPQSREIDSLNLSIAVGIVLYVVGRE